MALTIGTQLGSYEITALLGKGGMGEVYRARDTKLKREVAIKILPDEFSLDADRVARFQREAEALAALNHQNIGTIYDLQQIDNTRFLILELVEGDTLADVLVKRGALPVEEALNVAKQVCEALEAAHEKGVVHRDLKPANVKITPDGNVKVLDFGLAKAIEDRSGASSLNQANSPTLTLGHTRTGQILGTPAYMAPEQVLGRTADRRADNFSFGAVMYELLTGVRAFDGATSEETLAAVLKVDPDWSKLPDDTPMYLRSVLERCLTKDRRQRLQAIGEARIALEKGEAGGTPAGAQPARFFQFRKFIWPAITAAFAALALWTWLKPTPHEPTPVIRVSTTFPILNVYDGLAISRDGSRIAFVGGPSPGQIYVRDMEQLEPHPLSGTTGATFLEFSPDGQQISFVTGGRPSQQLKKVTLKGGLVQTLTDVITGTGPPTHTWSEEGTIFLTSGGALVRVPSTGGKAVVLATPDIEKSEVYFSRPQVLPGGRQILLSAIRGQTGRILVFNPKTGVRKTLLENAQNGQFIPLDKSPTQGYLVYYAEANRSLVATSFDADRLQVKGDPVPVVDSSIAGRNNQFARIAISNSGTLVYTPQMIADPEARHTVAWVDLQGSEQPLGAPARDYRSARVSPVDPNRIALEIASDTREIWIYDSDRGTLDRIATGGLNPIWTPDGKEILYARSIQSGAAPALMAAPADRSSGPAVLATNERALLRPYSISFDGKFLLGDFASEKGLWALPVDRSANGSKLRSILESEYNKTTPDISPDGHWVAYVANDTGRQEVYISSYPEAGPKITISTDGGNLPRWDRNGRELFYRSGDKLMAVDIQAGPPFRASRPRMLFGGYYNDYSYDVARDGQHFLMIKPATRPEPQPNDQVIIIFNWFSELQQRMPVK